MAGYLSFFLPPALSHYSKENNMPKYRVTMNYVSAYGAKFVVEAKDPDELHDLLGEMDLDFLEENAGFQVCDYEPPIIEDFEKVGKHEPVNQTIQKEMKKILKAWEAL